MRKQFVQTTEKLLRSDDRTVVLLGDIGVFGFKNAFDTYPTRVYNIGILEQSTVGMAAGISMTGLIPIVHTIAPFLVERSIEQLKDDFCFQKLGGNFVSVGASYDYAALGATHHCAGDVGMLKQIPGMEIIVPGTPAEFDQLLTETYANGHPTYFRLSERDNKESQAVAFGKAVVVKEGKKATVVVVGPMLDRTLEACKDEDVTILYYTTISPFDADTLRSHCSSGKILLVEPYYKGGLTNEIMNALAPLPIRLETVGVPLEFLSHYGKAEDHDKALHLLPSDILTQLHRLTV